MLKHVKTSGQKAQGEGVGGPNVTSKALKYEHFLGAGSPKRLTSTLSVPLTSGFQVACKMAATKVPGKAKRAPMGSTEPLHPELSLPSKAHRPAQLLKMVRLNFLAPVRQSLAQFLSAIFRLVIGRSRSKAPRTPIHTMEYFAP